MLAAARCIGQKIEKFNIFFTKVAIKLDNIFSFIELNIYKFILGCNYFC